MGTATTIVIEKKEFLHIGDKEIVYIESKEGILDFFTSMTKGSSVGQKFFKLVTTEQERFNLIISSVRTTDTANEFVFEAWGESFHPKNNFERVPVIIPIKGTLRF